MMMKGKTKKLIALGLVVLGLTGTVPSFWSQVAAQTAAQADTGRNERKRRINLDVACDCRTFSFNRGVSFDQVVRGDGFIVNGKIFPAGTLPEGAASNDPNDPGSVGKWICRGTQAVSFADIIAGAPHPHVFFTQYHLLDDRRGLVSDGASNETRGVAAVVGGLGSLSGAGGDVSATIIGTNSTGCPNIRFTFNLTKQAPK
jgi:hypothetical protein